MDEIKKCRYCGGNVNCFTSKEFYGRDYRGTHVYQCESCKAYGGSHPNSKKPLGTIANTELRDLRKKAHAVVDPFWKDGHMQRRTIYRRLGEFMNKESKDAHIGMFEIEECKKVIEGFRKFIFTRNK